LIEDALVQLPGAVLVGIGQGRALGRVGQPQVPQFAFAGGQATANLAQRLRPAQVAEQHGHKLPPAGKSAGMTLGPMLDNGPFKLVPGKQLQHLAENAGYSYHGGGGPPLWLTSSSTQTVAEFYPRRRSQANLDKSDSEHGLQGPREALHLAIHKFFSSCLLLSPHTPGAHGLLEQPKRVYLPELGGSVLGGDRPRGQEP